MPLNQINLGVPLCTVTRLLNFSLCREHLLEDQLALQPLYHNPKSSHHAPLAAGVHEPL